MGEKLSELIQEVIKDCRNKEVTHYLNLAYLLQKQEEESPKQ